MNNYEYKRQLERSESYKKMKWWASGALIVMVISYLFAFIAAGSSSPHGAILATYPLFGARLMWMISCGYLAQSKGRSELWGLWVLFFGVFGFIPTWLLKTRSLND